MHVEIPLDVVIHIMSATVRKRDLSRTMRVSRDVYQAGLPLLLREVSVFIDNHVQSFIGFMQNNADASRHIQLLEIDLVNFHLPAQEMDDIHSALAQIIRNAYRLEKLGLSEFEALDTHPALRDAICRLPALKALRLNYCPMTPDNLHNMFKHMASKIGTLSFDLSQPMSRRQTHPDWNVNLQNTVCALAMYLEKLEIEGPILCNNSQVVFPQMQALKALPDTSKTIANRYTLARTFPNLKVLDLVPPVVDLFGDLDLEDVRAENQETLARGRWQSLDWLRGDLEQIYMLHFGCPVKTLRIRQTYIEILEELLTPTIEELMPVNLMLHIDASPSSLRGSMTVRVGSEHTRRLVLNVKVEHGGDPTQFNLTWHQCLSFFTPALEGLNITYLRLQITWGEQILPDLDSDEEGTISLPREHPLEGRYPSARTGLRRYARHLMRLLPTLEYIFLSADDYEHLPLRVAFRRVQNMRAGGAMMVELSDEERVGVMRENESVWEPSTSGHCFRGAKINPDPTDYVWY